jgi:PAS domain S-box-containing protein
MKIKTPTAEVPGNFLSKSSIRLLLSICLIIFIAGACSVFVINWQMKMHAREEAREKAMMILDRNLAIHTYFSHQLKPVLFEKMKPLVQDNYFEPVWMSSTYAVRGIDQYFQSITKRDFYYKECAVNARSPENEADKFERAFIEKLNKTPGLDEYSGVRVINAKPYFVVLRRGETMEQSCLRCHSTPEAAPSDMVTHYGPERSFDRSVGEVVSAISIRIPLDIAYAHVNRLIAHLSILLGLTLLIVCGAAAYLCKIWVFDPLNTIRLNAAQISRDPALLGDQITLPSTSELAELAKAFNAMSFQLRIERDGLESRVAERTQELRRSEKRYRLLFENMSEGFALHEILTDADGKPCDYRFLEINPAFESLTGLSREAAVGKTVREVIPGIESHWIETYGRVALDGTPLHFENYSAPLDRWYDVFAYRTAPGQFAAIFTDITERKRAEEQLRHLSHFPEENPNPVLRCTPDGKMLYANAPARQWLETLGWRTDGPLPPAIGAAIGEACCQSHTIEAEITNPAGRTFSIFAVQPPGVNYINLYAIDLTERKRAEQALRLSEERLKRSQAIAHLGSWELDLQKNELTWSDEVYRLFGLAPGRFEATYEAFLAAVHPDDRNKVDEAYSGSLRDNIDTYEIEHRIVRPDGEIRYVHEKCAHHRDASGTIIRSAGMVHDITDRKRVLEALERSNSELEQFAYVASHDLQEPLRAIVGFLQLLQNRYEDLIDETGRHFIERSVKAGHRMQTLIRELLTLSRVNTKGAKFESTDLNGLVKDVLDNLQPLLKEKNVEIIRAELPNLMIDASQIRSLFQNLIVNAVRYNESPEPRVEIGCLQRDNVYEFFMKDNGIGISPKFYQRIFMVFQRLHTEREYPGTGLGLALCKKIVERHGGAIWVESGSQAGSTFHFTLPRKR